MGASNTPLHDLIELSSINANATMTVTPGGGGDILGVVDTATYTDDDSDNSATQLAELNEDGSLTIDGVAYNIMLAVPDSSSDRVTVTYNDGASSIDLEGDGGTTEVVFITASPMGGGANRYFVVFDDAIGDLPAITSIQIPDLDFTVAGGDVKINLDQDNDVAPVCYTAGTQILTPAGYQLVECLSAGDEVTTLLRGRRPIRWIGRQKMTFLDGCHKHKPIQIKAGALGPMIPRRDLVVSPQHRILIHGPDVMRYCGTHAVFVVAKALTCLPGIRQMSGRRKVEYFSLLFDQHEILIAEGAKAESFFPGPNALQFMDPKLRREVEFMFPPLRHDPANGYGPLACPVLFRRDAEELFRLLGKDVDPRDMQPKRELHALNTL